MVIEWYLQTADGEVQIKTEGIPPNKGDSVYIGDYSPKQKFQKLFKRRWKVENIDFQISLWSLPKEGSRTIAQLEKEFCGKVFDYFTEDIKISNYICQVILTPFKKED